MRFPNRERKERRGRRDYAEAKCPSNHMIHPSFLLSHLSSLFHLSLSLSLFLFIFRFLTVCDICFCVSGARSPPWGPTSLVSTRSSISKVKGNIIAKMSLEAPACALEEQPLIDSVECRICQEEDHLQNLETPCACSGSLKYAHRKCVQRWCDEKRNITCEICHQTYLPGYAVRIPSVPRRPDDVTIDISEGWMISGTPVPNPRLLEEHRLDNQYNAFVAAEQRLMESEFDDFAAAERHLLETGYDEYAATNASGQAFCRFAALTLLALFLFRHALDSGSSTDEDDDEVSTFFSIFFMRALGFLLPCYFMGWAIHVMQRRREREEETRLAASEVAFVLQSVQDRGLQFAIVPGHSMNHSEPQPC